MMKYLSKLALILLLAAGVTTCSDYLKPSTPQSKPTNSLDSVEDLTGLMNGAYERLSDESLYGRDFVVLGDVRTGNAWSNGNSGRFINSSLFNTTPAGSGGIWTVAYRVIANCNLVINSEVEGKGVAQVKGEAYAVRALAHTILLKMYGQQFVDGSNLGIPYVTKFAGEIEGKFFPDRPTVEQTLAKIEADYKKALTLLKPSITTPVTRMTYYAAKALLARFYLFTDNYAAASAAAKDVIDSGVYNLVEADKYVEAWKADGKPAVLFEIAFTQTDNEGSDSIFQILAGESYGDVEVTEELFKIYGPDDVRNGLYATEVTSNDTSSARINYRMIGKFPDQFKNTPVIRYAGVILIYAESQARLGNAVEALTYLNKIPNHRNAEPYLVASIDNILLERRKELAMEGLYYWTLLRTGQDIARTDMRPNIDANEVTVPYGDHRLAYPIPLSELSANPNMVQNQGYGGG